MKNFNRLFLQSKTYSELRKNLLPFNCKKCPLHKKRNHLVIDRGNPAAKVLMIGEAPGRQEDLQGKAFVGRSGKLLDRLLDERGFSTDRDSLIINVVKCRPPHNRPPKAEEVEQCWPLLKKQMDLVKPKIVLLLGRTALKRMVPQKKPFSMNREAGHFFKHPEYPGTKWMILFHPAYILRNPRKKPLMVSHLKRFISEWYRLD